MTVKKKKLAVVITVVTVLLTVMILWLFWGNTAIELNKYTVKDSKIPVTFSGFRIVHISDLHNAEIGEDNEKLLSVLYEAEPDIIAITGDLIDSRNTDIETVVFFAEKAVKIAPCYYVTGNHEARVSVYDELKKKLIDLGVNVLDNKQIELVRNGESISLIGADDPDFRADYLFDDVQTVMKAQLQEVIEADGRYGILLSHRPELFDLYKELEVNLALCGHAHGGQIRFPFIGGLFAPGQGFFPEYDSGFFSNGESKMIVSRGIGNSLFPLRVNNRPEVIVIELQSD